MKTKLPSYGDQLQAKDNISHCRSGFRLKELLAICFGTVYQKPSLCLLIMNNNLFKDNLVNEETKKEVKDFSEFN